MVIVPVVPVAVPVSIPMLPELDVAPDALPVLIAISAELVEPAAVSILNKF